MSRRIHGFTESKGYCAETCPDVDGAFSDAWQDLKDLIAPQLSDEAEKILDALCARVKEVGTDKLRAALCEAIRDKESIEGDCAELKRNEADLESQIADLEAEVADLSHELSKVAA